MVCLRPPKGDFTDILSSDCHDHLIPFLWSYIFNSLVQILSKIPDCIHSWNLLWHVEPEPYSLGNIFHWHQVLKTDMIPSSTFLYGTIGLPMVFSGFSSGKIILISFHRLSGMRMIVLIICWCFLLFNCSINKDDKNKELYSYLFLG